MPTKQFIKNIKSLEISHCLLWIEQMGIKLVPHVQLLELPVTARDEYISQVLPGLTYELHEYCDAIDDELFTSLAVLKTLLGKLLVANPFYVHLSVMCKIFSAQICLSMENNKRPAEYDGEQYSKLLASALDKHRAHLNVKISTKQKALTSNQHALINTIQLNLDRFHKLLSMLSEYNLTLSRLQAEDETATSSILEALGTLTEQLTVENMISFDSNEAITKALESIKTTRLEPWEQKCVASVLTYSFSENVAYVANTVTLGGFNFLTGVDYGAVGRSLLYPFRSGFWRSAIEDKPNGEVDKKEASGEDAPLTEPPPPAF